MTMTLEVNSRTSFSLFAAGKLKKKIEKEKFKLQCGSKSAGAEAMIHIFQQIGVQNLDFDVVSAEAIKAFFNLN